MNRVTIAGNLIVDYVKQIGSYPAQGMLESITSVSRSVGGCAANTSVSLALMDETLSVTATGRVGDDENGRYIKDVLENHGVNCRIKVDTATPTSFTDVMTAADGERTFFHARGANTAFCPGDIDIDSLECELFHIGYILLLDSFDATDLEYGTVLAKTLAKIRKRGIKTSVDVVSENSKRFAALVCPVLPYCDYLIVNEVEAGMVTGISPRMESGELIEKNIRLILERLMELGVNELAAVHAPEGGWALKRGGEFACAPSLNLPQSEIRGKVGAGDAFCAGMLYAICRDFSLEEALRYAAASAACNLTAPDSIGGMRNRAGIEEMLRKWE